MSKSKEQLFEEIEQLKTKHKIAEDKFSTIYNQSLDAFLIVDLNDSEILDVSPAIRHVLGYDTRAIIGKNMFSLFPDDTALNSKTIADNFEAYGTVVTQRFLRANGTVSSIDLTVSLIDWEGKEALLFTLRDATERIKAKEEREKLIRELQEAATKIKKLNTLLPICASCKKIRDDDGYWHQVEEYIRDHADVRFSHGICPDCMVKLYPEFVGEK